ncbi:unnamed protein product [Trypanosoma congolense IL3000]|uniref:WGS project CAEQ00000000 data, annotated contig 1281 n=1 Tax=Trypanosoma congolense (strain IL3000) TaxID=1068625 RepID=F9W567_TRYCI|nr:unnamed protein product [Trypanosoma congolense IL3000]
MVGRCTAVRVSHDTRQGPSVPRCRCDAPLFSRYGQPELCRPVVSYFPPQQRTSLQYRFSGCHSGRKQTERTGPLLTAPRVGLRLRRISARCISPLHARYSVPSRAKVSLEKQPLLSCALRSVQYFSLAFPTPLPSRHTVSCRCLLACSLPMPPFSRSYPADKPELQTVHLITLISQPTPVDHSPQSFHSPHAVHFFFS